GVRGGADVGRAAVDAAHRAVLGVADDAALGGDDRTIAAATERAPHELLVGERPVHVGSVEERHAEVERAMDGGNRLRLVARAVEFAHAHAPEADGRDLERTESSCLHGGLGYARAEALATRTAPRPLRVPLQKESREGPSATATVAGARP